MATKIEGDGSVFLTGKSAPNPDVAGDFQIWTENRTPTILMGADDSGTRHLLQTFLGTEIDTSTGATSYTISDIPSGTKKIEIGFIGLSTNGLSFPMLQIGGSGGPETSNYISSSLSASSGLTTLVNATSGFILSASHGPLDELDGTVSLFLENSSNFSWTYSGILTRRAGPMLFSVGSKSLSEELTQIKLTTVSLTQTFDAGVISLQFS